MELVAAFLRRVDHENIAIEHFREVVNKCLDSQHNIFIYINL